MIFLQSFSTILRTHSKVSFHFVQETEGNSYFSVLCAFLLSLYLLDMLQKFKNFWGIRILFVSWNELEKLQDNFMVICYFLEILVNFQHSGFGWGFFGGWVLCFGRRLVLGFGFWLFFLFYP